MNLNLLNNFVKLIVGLRSLTGNDGPAKLPHIQVNRNLSLTFPQLAALQGYRAEEHKTVTEDGYKLTIFRIPRGIKCEGPVRRPPVLLIHGLLQSADSFIDAGPKNGLGYLLPDECYDTWLGNVRGTFYSRAHVSLNPDKDRKFWQFSVDEMGLCDIPAFIDYVLKATGAPQLNYVGFSQGGGTFMIMCSERPGYCDKVSLFIALAPATRLFNMKSKLAKAILKVINKSQGPLEELGVWEVFTKGFPTQKTANILCQNRLLAAVVCGNFASTLNKSHKGSITGETTKLSFSHSLAGTSIRNLARYAQAVKYKKFVKFDYGRQKNLKIYGMPTPPEYNLKAVTAPAVVIQGIGDTAVDIKDSLWAAKQFPRLLEYVTVDKPNWNHRDQISSQYVGETMFPIIRKYLHRFSYE